VVKLTEQMQGLSAGTIALFDSGLKAKYHQKVGEGKPKTSVLNIIRAKLIERIFTVVNVDHHRCELVLLFFSSSERKE
jgi:hypothetical protein